MSCPDELLELRAMLHPGSRAAAVCPPCAASEFGYRPGVAANYNCAWEPGPAKPASITDATSAR
jgi:hypothetical protein